MARLIDSHAHLNFNAYQDDGQQVISRALAKGIWIVNVGSQFSTSKRAVQIANQYPQGVYAAIGLHPIHLFKTKVDEEEIKFNTREEKFNHSKYQNLIKADQKKKIVAVGEIGLDYYHLPKEKTFDEVKEIQRQELIQQLEFANQNNLPVILHCRGSQENSLGAYYDLLKILSSVVSRWSLAGVIHCFGGNLEIAQEFMKLGFYIGFTGIITFTNLKAATDKLSKPLIHQVVENTPLDRILVETDCPYLAPHPYRGQRNEPAYVELVAKKVAEIKNASCQEVTDITMQNAKKLYKLS